MAKRPWMATEALLDAVSMQGVRFQESLQRLQMQQQMSAQASPLEGIRQAIQIHKQGQAPMDVGLKGLAGTKRLM